MDWCASKIAKTQKHLRLPKVLLSCVCSYLPEQYIEDLLTQLHNVLSHFGSSLVWKLCFLLEDVFEAIKFNKLSLLKEFKHGHLYTIQEVQMAGAQIRQAYFDHAPRDQICVLVENVLFIKEQQLLQILFVRLAYVDLIMN